MRSSLIFKLMGAFLLVIAIGALVISLFTWRATRNAFNLYTTRNGKVWAERLAPVLAEYYLQSNSWQGVDTFLQGNFIEQYFANNMGNIKGRGMGGRKFSEAGMRGTGQRLVLADASGVVISDTQNEFTGKQLAEDELNNGVAVTVDDRQIGTLIISPQNLTGSDTATGEFLSSVNHAIINSVTVAGIIALILGAVLFLQITAPLGQLKKAASAIARGDLSQRVFIRSHDELGELGSTFNMMAESLSNAEIQRQHLMADVAHELRTPLTAIQGTLEGIQDGVLPLDQEQVASLHAETMLLNRLVNDLRLLSLAETGHLKLELQEVLPGEIIQQIVERAKTQAALKNIILTMDIQPGLPVIHLDTDRITQVLNNLIANALRYTPDGGTVMVSMFLPTDGDSLHVSVTDTGPGIDAEHLPYIFDRFYRADKSRARFSGGSGLGLAIVKQLIEAHGGTVKAESPVFEQEGQRAYGTRVTFTLPAVNLKHH